MLEAKFGDDPLVSLPEHFLKINFLLCIKIHNTVLKCLIYDT